MLPRPEEPNDEQDEAEAILINGLILLLEESGVDSHDIASRRGRLLDALLTYRDEFDG